jgi:hypothetical protein
LQWDDPKIKFHAIIKELEARLQPISSDKKIVLIFFINPFRGFEVVGKRQAGTQSEECVLP